MGAEHSGKEAHIFRRRELTKRRKIVRGNDPGNGPKKKKVRSQNIKNREGGSAALVFFRVMEGAFWECGLVVAGLALDSAL